MSKVGEMSREQAISRAAFGPYIWGWLNVAPRPGIGRFVSASSAFGQSGMTGRLPIT